MSQKFDIRAARHDDLPAIESLYPKAFPEEDLVPLVRELAADPGIVVSLLAMVGPDVAGHALFTLCSVGHVDAALLGPLAVAPDWQRQGVGSALVRDGLARLEETGVVLVCVLGDPAYYGRLGFETETNVAAPYSLPDEWLGAWQSQYLSDTDSALSGKLDVPEPWRKPELWAP